MRLKILSNVLFVIFFMHFLSFIGFAQKADELGKITLRLNPGDDNPRNSEGDFVTLKDGSIVFIYSRYTGKSTNDHAPAYLASRKSVDQGKTWTKNDQLVLQNEGGMNVMSVSLLRLQNGSIALFYLRKNSEIDCIPMMRISNDEAKTWSEAIPCITDKKGYFVLNNNRAIQLKNGRLLIPVALHRPATGNWNSKGTLFSYFSDDYGKSWKSSGEVPNNSDIVTQEPGVVELKDGKIMMFIRASGGVQQLSYSSDKGESWSTIEPSNIHSPLSPASIARIPKTGDLFLVWNNNDGSIPEIKNKRTPLTIAISKDDGKTWIHAKNIETDTDGWYCYMAIHFTKKDVLLGYCAGSLAKKTELSITDIKLISLKSL